MNKQTLELVIQTFESNPNVGLFNVTSDGQCFEKRNMAILHASKLSDQSILSMTKEMAEEFLKSPKQVEADSAPKLSAEDRIEKVKSMSSVDELNAMFKIETAKTVKAAIDKRLINLELINAINSTETPEALEALLKDQIDEEVLAAGESRKKQFEGE